MNKTLLSYMAAIAALALWVSPASALSLEEAGVEKGEAEVEYEGTYTDKNGSGISEERHEFEVQLGITEWLKLGVEAEFEGEEDGGGSIDFTEFGANATIELIDPEKGGFGFALYGGISTEREEEDDEGDTNQTGKIGIIAEQTFNKFLVRGNLFYLADIGGREDEAKFDGVEYAYQVTYQFSDMFAFGVEGYGNDLDYDEDEADAKTHMVGPVIYFTTKLSDGNGQPEEASDDDDGDDDDEEEGLMLAVSAGVLFGTNDQTADTTFKWNFGLEF